MKIIEPSVKEIKDFEGVDNFYKATARAARICYAKEMLTEEQAHYLLQQGKITLSESIKNTANIENDKAFCERLIKSGHLSPFEHAIIYVPFNIREYRSFTIQNMINSKYAIIKSNCPIIALNGRLIIENLLIDKSFPIQILDEFLGFLKKIALDTHLFKSFIVDTSIGCTRELNRHHDNFYVCEQSTRYVNFSKDKFGNEVAFNKPYWYDSASSKKQKTWEFAMGQAEYNYINNQYMFSIDEIRGVLPLDTHTRAIYTSTVEEWQHIIDLRLKGTTGKPHGDIKIIAEKIDKLINR